MSVPRVNPYPWKFAMSYTAKGLSHIYILHETGDAGAHRVVYMDGRKHPDDLIPSWWGHSIGRWEGETLVIDTVARTPGPIGVGPNDLSERAHFTERVRRIDQDALEVAMTIEDPLRFTHPWQLNIRYSRVTEIDRIVPWDCANDRNPIVDGALTIEPPR
jgi:hypothetical protein